MAVAAYCYGERVVQGWANNAAVEAGKGAHLAARAIELGQDDGNVLWMAAHATLRLVHDRQRAKELAYRSIELNPNSAIAVSVAGIIEAMSGNSDKALELLQRAQRLNPRDPRNWLIAASFALSHFVAGRYEEAVSFNSRALLQNPRYLASLRILTASLALLGQQEKAAEALDRFLKMDPQASLSTLRIRLGFMDERVWKRLAEGLRLAGLRE